MLVLLVVAEVLRVVAEVVGDNDVCPLSVPVMNASPLSSSTAGTDGDLPPVLSVVPVAGLKPKADDAEGEVPAVDPLSNPMRVKPAANTKYGTKQGVRRRVKRLA